MAKGVCRNDPPNPRPITSKAAAVKISAICRLSSPSPVTSPATVSRSTRSALIAAATPSPAAAASTSLTPGSIRSMIACTRGTYSTGRYIERALKLIAASCNPVSCCTAASILAAQFAQSRPWRINFLAGAFIASHLSFLNVMFLGQPDQPDDVVVRQRVVHLLSFPAVCHQAHGFQKPQMMRDSWKAHLQHVGDVADARSEEHTSELQSRENLVCRLLLEKKKRNNTNI